MRHTTIIHGESKEPLHRLPGAPGHGAATRYLLPSLAVGLTIVLAGCFAMRVPQRAVTLDDIHKPPRIVPRHAWVQAHPGGVFKSQKPQYITLLDAGSHVGRVQDILESADQPNPIRDVPSADTDADGLLSYSYVRMWGSIIGPNAYQDIPVHFIVDQAGITWAGRAPNIQGEIYAGGRASRSYREPDSETRPEDRKRLWGPRLDTDGHLLVLVVGNFDTDVLTDKQEPVMMQLLYHLCQNYEISPRNIGLLSDIAPSTENPGMYLRNYAESGILTKLINEPIRRGQADSFSLFENPRVRSR